MTEKVNAPGDPSMTSILIPLDGSSEALSALPYAMALATPGTELVLLTVVGEDDARPSAQAALEQAAERARVAGHDVRTEVVSGNPAEQIIAAAASPGRA